MTNPKLTKLKEKNYRVKIIHYRPFQTKIKRTNKDNLTVYLPKYWKRNRDFQLLSRGGWCTLQVFSNDKLIEETISVCHEADNYDYREAVNKAIDKLTAPEFTL